MLSYLVGYFFSARVQAVAQEDAFKDKVYLAYSGGDDLFAIGSWSVLPEFAKRIREEFGNFTSHALTLSAGVYVAPSVKFPVYEAADQAGEAEKAAKTEHTSKDRISFLGSTVTWAELNNAREVKDELVKLIGNGLPKSILGFLGSSWQQQKETKDGKIPVYPIWRLLYAFKRLKERHKDLAPRICDIEQKVVVANGLRPRLDLIIRWAEYEVRRKDAE
jgi:CRISPR-associated protein Csm1